MPMAFTQVPDWISWENQGGNIAVADLDGDGSPELLVLRIDHPVPGPNRGFYRIGHKLDAQGGIAQWGPWVEVPNWGSDQNQGGGIAVANFGAAGRGWWYFKCSLSNPAQISAASASAGSWRRMAP